MKCPCKDCENRTPGCHAKCEEYREFAAWCEEIRKRERNRMMVFGYVKDAVYASRQQSRRGR